MGESKAAYAERKKQSGEKFLHRYKKDYGDKYFHKLPNFVKTMISRKNCSIDSNQKISKNQIFCPSFTVNFSDNSENQLWKLQIEFAAQSMNCHSERFSRHNLRK